MTCSNGSGRERRPTPTVIAVLAVGLTLAISGCANEGPTMTDSPSAAGAADAADAASRTLEDAKSEYFAVLDEITALVAEDEMAAWFPRRTTSPVLFDCESPNTYYWPSAEGGTLAPTADPAAIVDRVEEAFSGRLEWEVTRLDERDRAVVPLRLVRDDGVFITVSVRGANDDQLDLNGFTACFTLMDRDPNAEY